MKIIVLWVEAFVQGFEPPCFHFFVSENELIPVFFRVYVVYFLYW